MAYRNVCGPYIRDARLAKGWTQAELARELEICELGLNAAVISRIERQQRRVVNEELVLIAAALGVPVGTLVPKKIGPTSLKSDR